MINYLLLIIGYWNLSLALNTPRILVYKEDQAEDAEATLFDEQLRSRQMTCVLHDWENTDDQGMDCDCPESVPVANDTLSMMVVGADERIHSSKTCVVTGHLSSACLRATIQLHHQAIFNITCAYNIQGERRRAMRTYYHVNGPSFRKRYSTSQVVTDRVIISCPFPSGFPGFFYEWHAGRYGSSRHEVITNKRHLDLPYLESTATQFHCLARNKISNATDWHEVTVLRPNRNNLLRDPWIFRIISWIMVPVILGATAGGLVYMGIMKKRGRPWARFFDSLYQPNHPELEGSEARNRDNTQQTRVRPALSKPTMTVSLALSTKPTHTKQAAKFSNLRMLTLQTVAVSPDFDKPKLSIRHFDSLSNTHGLPHEWVSSGREKCSLWLSSQSIPDYLDSDSDKDAILSESDEEKYKHLLQMNQDRVSSVELVTSNTAWKERQRELNKIEEIDNSKTKKGPATVELIVLADHIWRLYKQVLPNQTYFPKCQDINDPLVKAIDNGDFSDQEQYNLLTQLDRILAPLFDRADDNDEYIRYCHKLAKVMFHRYGSQEEKDAEKLKESINSPESPVAELADILV